MALSVFPFWLLFTSHCLFVCYGLRPVLKNTYWLYNLIATLICAMGGNVIRSFLLGLRPAMLESNYFPLTIIASWYAINYSPYDVVYQLYKRKPIWVLGLLIEQITKSHSIFASVEISMKHLPEGALLGIIAVSTLGGMGGALISSFLYNANIDTQRHSHQPPQQQQHQQQAIAIPYRLSEFSKPTWNIKSAFWGVIAYLFTATHYALIPLDKETVEYTITALLVGASIFQEFSGPITPFPINAIENLFYFITRIQRHHPNEKTE